jgi:uncharacterized protein YoxC
MIAVLSGPDAAVIAAIVTAIVGPAILVFLGSTRRALRGDHAEVGKALDELKKGQRENGAKLDDLAAELRDVKADVRDLRSADRDQSDRLTKQTEHDDERMGHLESKVDRLIHENEDRDVVGKRYA